VALAIPPPTLLQVGALGSLPMAVEPPVATAVTMLAESVHSASASLPEPEPLAVALLLVAEATALAVLAPSFAVAL